MGWQVDRERHRFDLRGATSGCGLERGHTYGGGDPYVCRNLDRKDRVACVDRSAKTLCAIDCHDVAQLRGAQQPRNSRHKILAEGRGRTEDVTEVFRECCDLRGPGCGERVSIDGIVDAQHAIYAGEHCRLLTY